MKKRNGYFCNSNTALHRSHGWLCWLFSSSPSQQLIISQIARQHLFNWAKKAIVALCTFWVKFCSDCSSINTALPFSCPCCFSFFMRSGQGKFTNLKEDAWRVPDIISSSSHIISLYSLIFNIFISQSLLCIGQIEKMYNIMQITS